MKAFKLFDDDDSGRINLRNLRRVARELGENISDEELRSMIDEFDTDGDGESEWWFYTPPGPTHRLLTFCTFIRKFEGLV